MDYLQHEINLGPDDVVEVLLDKQANVRLLDDLNFARYQRGEQHTYYGGLFTHSTARIAAPHPGRWHVVVDLGGYAGSVRPAIRVLHPA